jgi:hypothetical protein
MEKLHITQFIAKISDHDLMKAVEAYLEWQSSGTGIKVIETSEKTNRTVIDDLYDLYTEPLEGPGITPWLAAYDMVTREIAKRCYLRTFENRYNT